jgi:hypothetical protein
MMMEMMEMMEMMDMMEMMKVWTKCWIEDGDDGD